MTKALRSPVIVIGVVVALVVVLVWLLAFFIPQGHKLNTLSTQESALEVKQSALEARLAVLEKTATATPQLLQLQNDFAVAVPPLPNTYTYITTMVGTTGQAGVKLISITTGVPGSASNGIAPIQVQLATTGTYDQTLTLIHLLNVLPRLTIINSMDLNGGGPSSTRSSQMTENFSLTIFTSYGSSTGSSTATSTTAS